LPEGGFGLACGRQDVGQGGRAALSSKSSNSAADPITSATPPDAT